MPDRLTWAGHATVLLELGGARLLTDPFLRARPLHLRRHAPPVDPALVDDLDAVLISHQHYDHLHLPSLRGIRRDVPVVVARGAGGLLVRAGFTDVREVAAADELEVGGVTVRVVHADHDGRRRPGLPAAQPVGFVVGDDGGRVYFAGDTAVFDAMAGLSAAPVDVALLPIWGWGPRLGPGHMDPEQAAHAAALVRAAVAVPIHWGTYYPHGLGRRRRVAFSHPPQRFAAAVARLAPDVDVVVLQPGDTLGLPARAGAVSPPRPR